MIAATYARKSTEQTGIADDQRSVARQIDHARQYAARKGWTVTDAYVYVDDGISGAEFANRPGFLALDERAQTARAVSGAHDVGRIPARARTARRRVFTETDHASWR